MKTYSVNAFHLTEKLKLKDIGGTIELQPLLLSVWEAAFKLGEDKFLFIYNFGSLVFFNVPEDEQRAVVEKVKKINVPNQAGFTTTDTFSVEVDSAVERHEVG